MIVGLDIGGANLKAADATGAARSRPFALWQRPADLAAELRALLAGFPPPGRLAVTMTGEQCDCFPTHRDGVRHVLAAVAALGVPAWVWAKAGGFLPLADADTLAVAAGNWHALATFVGRFAPRGPAALVDVGSTTSDLIPLRDGVPTPRGTADRVRLAAGDLLYAGVRRTPACAVLGFGGAAEFFATTDDAYVLLGRVPERPADTDTADRRPATVAFAHARLARMVCADAETMPLSDAEALARRMADAVQAALVARLRALPGPPATVVVSGEGEFAARAAVAEALPTAAVVSLADRLGPERSIAACAWAVAELLRERLP